MSASRLSDATMQLFLAELVGVFKDFSRPGSHSATLSQSDLQRCSKLLGFCLRHIELFLASCGTKSIPQGEQFWPEFACATSHDGLREGSFPPREDPHELSAIAEYPTEENVMNFQFTNTQLTVAVVALFLVVATCHRHLSSSAAKPGLSVSAIVLDRSTTALSDARHVEEGRGEAGRQGNPRGISENPRPRGTPSGSALSPSGKLCKVASLTIPSRRHRGRRPY